MLNTSYKTLISKDGKFKKLSNIKGLVQYYYPFKDGTFTSYYAEDTNLKVSFINSMDSAKFNIDDLEFNLLKHKEHLQSLNHTLERPYRIYKMYESDILHKMQEDKVITLEPYIRGSFTRFKTFKKELLEGKYLNPYIKNIQERVRSVTSTIETLEKNIRDFKNRDIVKGYIEYPSLALEAGLTPVSNYGLPVRQYDFVKIDPSDLKNFGRRPSVNVSNFIRLDYHANFANRTFTEINNAYRQKRHLSIDSRAINLLKVIGDYSFGLEIETNSGDLGYDKLYAEQGIVPLKDGSIAGLELATLPVGITSRGTYNKPLALKDISNLLQSLKLIESNFTANDRCSVHVHFGNVRKDKEFLLALYLFSYKIQKELYSFQPVYKMSNVRHQGLNKDYCKPLKKIRFEPIRKSPNRDYYNSRVTEEFDKVFRLLSNGESLSADYNRKAKRHPAENKWGREERYRWINLVNVVFNPVETIEFRLHSGTVNKTKILNWILLCAGILRYVESNVYNILSDNSKVSYNLDAVIEGYANNFKPNKTSSNSFRLELVDYLKTYVRNRKEYFKKLKEADDVLAKDEVRNDKKNVTEAFYLLT